MPKKTAHPPFAFLALLAALLIASFNALPSLAQDGSPAPDECRTAGCEKQKTSPYRAGPVAPANLGGPDHYGYTWDNGYTLSSWTNAWTDATSGGTQIAFGTKSEDDVVVTVALPFTFEYYEKAYTSVNISSNGIIGFDSSVNEEQASYSNLPIPHDFLPDAFVAPYWSDLTYPYIFYATGTDGRGQFFAVEWYQCQSFTQAGASLTFEVKLYVNGDIAFLYNQLTNPPLQKTVGIEEPDATYGLMYLYDAAGPNENQAILFNRPAEARRVKAWPAYQSLLNTGMQSVFKVQVRNTGDLDPTPSDTVNIQIEQSDPDWSVTLTKGDGITPLYNYDSNPLPDTGSLAPGQTFTVALQVNAPSNVTAGEMLTVTLTAISGENPAKTDTASLATVVPEPFAHIYRNAKLGEPAGVNIELISPRYRLVNLLNPTYTGATFMLCGMAGNRFLGIWENNLTGATTNLDFNAVEGNGLNLYQLTRHLTSNVARSDRVPAAARTPDGKIGVTWIRTETNLQTGAYYQNVYFGIMDDQAAGLVTAPISVTADTELHPPTQLFAYRDVTLAATDDNHFHLSWVEYHLEGPIATEDISQAVYTSAGGVVKSASFLTSQVDGVNYSGPALVPFVSGPSQRLLLLANQRLNPLSPIYKIVTIVLDGNGDIVNPQAELYTLRASDMDGVQTTTGGLAVTWIDLDTQKVNYVFLGQDLSKPSQPNVLSNPDNVVGGRSAGRVSVAKGGGGRAVLTWMDDSFQERLYYALVSGNGPAGVASKPVILRMLQKGVETTIETSAGFGSAEYTSIWRLLLPLARKK